MNNTFVPRLQALKPKGLLESAGGTNQAINLNEEHSINKLRRMTIMDEKAVRNRSLLNKTVNYVTETSTNSN